MYSSNYLMVMKKENFEKEDDSKKVTVFDRNTLDLDAIKYSFPHSKQVLQDIDLLYYLNNNSNKYTSKISSKYLLSTFIMEYLQKLNQLVKEKYSLENTSSLFEKDSVVPDKLDEISDEPLVSWLDDECLLELDDLIKDIKVFNKESLIKFGHILYLTKKELDELSVNQDLEIYDLFFRLKERLNSFEKTTIITKNHEIENIDSFYNDEGEKITKIILSEKNDKKSGKVNASHGYVEYFEY